MTALDVRMQSARMQQVALQSQARNNGLHTALNASRESGEKMAGSVKGDFVSFSKVLSREKEKQRRSLDYRKKQQQGQSKVQHLL